MRCSGRHCYLLGEIRLNHSRWHQDIKPANILVIGDIMNNPYEVEFMLADLGLSHFANAIEKGSGFRGEDMPGVRTYGESNHRPSDFPVLILVRGP